MTSGKQNTRSGMVAVIGRANVGKSTLVNRLLGEKVSIISGIAQTTRNMIRGILTEPRGQIVFLDTPGVHKATNDLGKLMNKMARNSVEGCDLALLVFDASRRLRDEDEGWMRKIAKQNQPCALVLNKCDVNTQYEGAYREAWSTIKEQKHADVNPVWYTISAESGDGVDALLDDLFDAVPDGPHLFPDDLLTDFPKNWTISDTVREKLFARLHQEVPHAIAVGVERIEEDGDQWLARVNIYVNRQSQKGIVIGNKGRLIAAVRKESEEELSEMYDRPVKLDLWVKVEKDWAKNFWILKQLGYVE